MEHESKTAIQRMKLHSQNDNPHQRNHPAQLQANKADVQLELFTGSLANGKWNKSLSGTSRTEPGEDIITWQGSHSGEFLTAATPEKQTDIRSCSAPC
jgi:hypothetical protein